MVCVCMHVYLNYIYIKFIPYLAFLNAMTCNLHYRVKKKGQVGYLSGICEKTKQIAAIVRRDVPRTSRIDPLFAVSLYYSLCIALAHYKSYIIHFYIT